MKKKNSEKVPISLIFQESLFHKFKNESVNNSLYVESVFPSLYPSLESLEGLILSNGHIIPKMKRYDRLVHSWNLIRGGMQTVEHELLQISREEWEHLNNVDEGLVCSHILAVVVTAYMNPRFKELDNHDKSIILWGCFFHDIAKRGPPEMQTKDPLHPFTSASKALRVFNRLGWIARPESVEAVALYINQAHFFHEWAQFMDNSQLPNILTKLLFVTGVISHEATQIKDFQYLCKRVDKNKLFVYEILVIVLLHQSLDFDTQFPNFTPLKKHEITQILSPRIITLLNLLFFGDSGSYYLPNPINQWDFINRSEESLRKYIKLFD